MTTYVSDQYADQMPTSSEAADSGAFQARYVFSSAVTLASGDIIKLAKLPPQFVVTDIRLETDAMGTSCAGSVGLLNADGTDMSQALIAIGSLATATIKQTDTTAGLRVGPVSTVTPIGVKITTSAGAALSAGAIISVTIRYRPKQQVEIA